MSSESTRQDPASSIRPRRDTKRSLEDFDRTALLLSDHLTTHYGEREAAALVRDARERYAEILPQVPWIEGRRAPALNVFLAITAQELAVYQAVTARGGNAAEAWEICHKAIRLRTARVPKWKRWLLSRFLFSRPARQVVRRREASQQLLRAGDFEVRTLVGDGKDFDFGVDYVRCGNLELARKVGAEAFAPYLCMSDIALSEAFGWGLIRTQTLADGCSHCDFRFKQGGETRITSRTPEVQATIDRIARDESAAAT
jgi:hypothetical protein